jgi:hypothetical protein
MQMKQKKGATDIQYGSVATLRSNLEKTEIHSQRSLSLID